MSDKHDADTIRIAPIRRTTVNPDAWGLHSVPTLLSDFQRHTSHGNLKESNKGETKAQSSLGPISPVESQEDMSKADRIVMLLSFVALPTVLLSVSHISVTDPLAATYILGFTLLTGLTTTQIPLSHLLVGLTCAIFSVVVLDSDGARNTSIIAALACLRPNFDIANPENMMNLQNGWLLIVILGVSMSTATWTLSFFAFILLVGLAWARINGANTGARRSTEKTTIGYLVSAAILLFAFFVADLNWMILLSSVIASCSLAMFFLVGDSIVPSRFDSVICGVLSAFVEVIVQSRFDWSQLFEVGALLPSVVLPVPGSDNDDELRTRKRTIGEGVAAQLPGSAWSVLDSILAHDDTRSIFYFFCLNFSFMLVQLLYSLLSHSLGLLSDSIHMFFDCLALLVGLVASILAKFPPSSRFPYGLYMVETVSGFANGCLLLAISVGVLFEAFERIANPVKLEKLTELIVVSALGLLVNFVGIFAFSHAHSHGGDGGHSHGHSHSHSHSHNHSHSHDHSHDEGQEEGSYDGSENMHGIFLHIVADTLGSVGVIISTLLLAWSGWHGWDAVASIVISVLIFASAVPLVRSSAKTLLLGLKANDEYCLRNLLNDIYNLEGVASYSVPKFWNDGKGIRGTIHVQHKTFYSDTRVRDKVRAVLSSGGIDQVTIQMEEEGSTCWCNNKKELSANMKS